MTQRPWEISDLLALRDGEVRDASVEVNDPAAVAQLEKIQQLQAQLNALPDVPLDESVWNSPNIAPASASRSAWLRFPLATAASVFFASFVGMYLIFGGGAIEQRNLDDGVDFAVNTQLDDSGAQLAALMNQSRGLERRLQGNGGNPLTLSDASSQAQNVTVDNAQAISPTQRRLMYRLADVDAQIARLYDAPVMDVGARQVLWAQRVNLLQSLVAVRGGSDPRFFEDSRSM
jgi:hypothetical protein